MVKSPTSVWYALLSFRHCNTAQLISSVKLLNNVNIMYSKIVPMTERNYEQFDRGRYFILCKFHKSSTLFARRDMNGSETWPRIWNIPKFSNYLCAFFFLQTMVFENLRNIFSWKYSFGNSLNTLMSFINNFRLSIEKVAFYWLWDITNENSAYKYIRRWMEKIIYKKRLGPKNSLITSISNVLFC